MNKTEGVLLDILRRYIVGKSEDQTINLPLDTLHRVMKLAKEHAVQGIVANEVVDGRLGIADGMPVDRQRTVMTLMQVEMMHKRNYTLFKKALADFALLMMRQGIPYVVFKGVAVARHYPVPYTRTMGDVDFYVPAADFDRAVDVIEREMHVEIEKEDVDKHYSFDYQGIRFEMHYQIETFGNGRHQRYFNQMIDQSIAKGADSFNMTDTESDADDVPVSVLPPTEDLIVVFKHWFNHLLVEGVGLRQTTDLAVLLNVYQDKIDVAQLMTALDRIGYMKAFRAMLAMVKKYFGVAWVDSLCVLNRKDERYADKLMTTVMGSGNFGRKAYTNHTSGKKKSMETATRALHHCVRFFWLAPWDICCLVPRRIGITLKLKPLLRATL